MATKKKVAPKKAAPKKAVPKIKAGERKQAPKGITSRAKISKYCEITKDKGQAGDTLNFGKHRLRMNRPLAKLTDAECDQTLKNLEEMGLNAHIKAMGKGTVSKRKAVVTTEPKPCECGCRAITRRGSRFLPGHDMKLKSKLRTAVKKGNANAKAHAQKELKSRGWA